MESGRHFLKDALELDDSVLPHVAWELDVLGLSTVEPALLNSLGYDALFTSAVS